MRHEKGKQSRYRDVASRVCAAFIGGYVVASAVSMLIARLLPISEAPATAVAILLAPLLYLSAILWVFTARSPARGWFGIGIVTALSALAVCGSIRIGGRL